MPTNISDEELLEDIKITELEFSAYDNIRYSFLILAQIPDSPKTTQQKYLKECEKYKVLAQECENFLEELLEIKEERGL